MHRKILFLHLVSGYANIQVGCPSKLVSIRNNRNQNVCFGCFASIPKQRVSIFRLNRNKQKTNRNSLIESILWHFFQKTNRIFFVFGFTKQTETQPKQILFRFVRNTTETDLVSVCFGSSRNFVLFVSRIPYIQVHKI